jgi:hypothetical protein
MTYSDDTAIDTYLDSVAEQDNSEADRLWNNFINATFSTNVWPVRYN